MDAQNKAAVLLRLMTECPSAYGILPSVFKKLGEQTLKDEYGAVSKGSPIPLEYLCSAMECTQKGALPLALVLWELARVQGTAVVAPSDDLVKLVDVDPKWVTRVLEPLEEVGLVEVLQGKPSVVAILCKAPETAKTEGEGMKVPPLEHQGPINRPGIDSPVPVAAERGAS